MHTCPSVHTSQLCGWCDIYHKIETCLQHLAATVASIFTDSTSSVTASLWPTPGADACPFVFDFPLESQRVSSGTVCKRRQGYREGKNGLRRAAQRPCTGSPAICCVRLVCGEGGSGCGSVPRPNTASVHCDKAGAVLDNGDALCDTKTSTILAAPYRNETATTSRGVCSVTATTTTTSTAVL